MSATNRSSGNVGNYEDPSAGAIGVTIFAACLMMLGGIWQMFAGLVAVVNKSFYVVGEKYVAQFNVTTWGWIHMLVGLVLFLAGIGLFSGATWARVVGVILAGVSALTMFFWLPYYPLWAILVIVLDIFILWALIAHGRDIRQGL